MKPDPSAPRCGACCCSGAPNGPRRSCIPNPNNCPSRSASSPSSEPNWVGSNGCPSAAVGLTCICTTLGPTASTISDSDACAPVDATAAGPGATNRCAILPRPSSAAIAPPATPASAVVPSAAAAIIGRTVRRRKVTIFFLVLRGAMSPEWNAKMGKACCGHYIAVMLVTRPPRGTAMGGNLR